MLARDEAQRFGEIVFAHGRLKVGQGLEVRLGLTTSRRIMPRIHWPLGLRTRQRSSLSDTSKRW